MKPNPLAIALLWLTGSTAFGQPPGKAAYLDPNLSPERRAADLVSRMTLEEKVLQMQSTAPAIERLGVPAYNWWNEALHGVAQGRATVFPQAIGLAATWDTGLMHRVADVISTEARAKYNDALTRPAPSGPDALATLPGRTAGLTYWSPNVNIFRDPRWGRGQETYGEDPYLAGRMAVAFVTGMQGDDPRYLKVVSTPKHYAVHSGPEPERHGFDARVSEHDLVSTYLPAFRTAVDRGQGRLDHVRLQRRERDARLRQRGPASEAAAGRVGLQGLRGERLRRRERHPQRNHKYAPTPGGAAVAAVKAGTDLTCGTEYKALVDEVKAGRIAEAEIDRSLERLFVARVRLGMFDPPEQVPWSRIPISENDSSAHREVAREAGREAIVLLKNEGGVLPLGPSVRRIAVDRPRRRRSRRAARQLQRHLVEAGDAARRDRAAVPGRAGALRPRRDLHGQHSRARSLGLPRAARGQGARRARRVLRQPRPPGTSRGSAGPSRARTSTWGWRTPPSSRRSATRSTRCAGRRR